MKIVPFLIFLFFCATATAQSTKIIGEQFLATNKNKAGVTTTPSGLQYMVLKKGDGTIPKLSDAVKVNYECKLIDGTVVDASANYGGAMQFNVAEVMPGWQEALQLMPNGSKYRLFIPSALAYGNTVVFKPASFAPQTAMLLVEVLVEAGLPKGVVNFVTGSGRTVGDTLVGSPKVHGVSFTGSVSVGTGKVFQPRVLE